jgi:diguanylate cyclase (GGDEF)-like protein/putative nucleotidyltransferase with HDIG domain
LLIHESTLSITLVITAALMCALFAYSYASRRQLYLLFWSMGWGFLSLHCACPIAGALLQSGPWAVAVDHWLLAAGVLMFFLSARLYAGLHPWTHVAGAAALIFAAWSALFALGSFNISPVFGVAIVLCATARLFWQESSKHETLADRGMAIAFVAWAALEIATALVQRSGNNPPPLQIALLVAPVYCLAVLMGMALYGEEKRHIERNMLALSNLNLATSGLVGSDVEKMLAQALERILSVVRMPGGALFLHHGDPDGPTSVVAEGLGDTFVSAAQQEGLDDHLVKLVSRLGGLAVFSDLERDSEWETLEREEAFKRFRQLALAQGMHTVAAISLQGKDNAFGVLLLGTPETRQFTSSELRLLLALGHQIGMTVENSYLIQQTSRRTEELHILNEIGRALSSTLDPNILFEKIYTEMQKVIAVTDMYIAFYDANTKSLRFDLEIDEGQRIAKRERPAGNHLSEYVIRTGQPLLIRENFAQTAEKLGVTPISQRGCFCAVPLVRHNRAVGLMAIHSQEERVFDEGHLDLMRVLASEATIALENARLFHGEQTKSRQLSLLNAISRNAISTLNPDEMLARMAEDLEHGLNYDHIGIGVLDYANKEVVIQAEAGHRRESLGRRIPLGEGIVGRVARSGEKAVVDDFSAERQSPPVLTNSASGAAMPIHFTDQLYGVLYVECSEKHNFVEEEIQVLTTVADLISGALHHAITFQRAQEQAMTDGLTGLKTHRFFMESLSAEWKRATRAGRPFSLVLIDLDRFKFVNDFYGHLEGNQVLQRVSKILEENCRRSDVVARYGGDEFVLLMPETNMEQARQLSNKLRAMVASEPLLSERNISGSFGIASYPVHGSTPQELVQVADSAMYLSKHQGGNAVSSAEHFDHNEAKRWKKDVLESYLGVTVKQALKTGPEALDEICQRLHQFTKTLAATDNADSNGNPDLENNSVPVETEASADLEGLKSLPPAVKETLTSLAAAVDAKDRFTNEHSQRVSRYAVALAEALELSADEIEEIRFAAVLHDVGKIGVPDTIINKNGPLNPEEWDLMQQHVHFGVRILEPFPKIVRIREMVEHHHEFFDGSGYPDGAAADAITMGARILALADAYDTITTDRAYKRARSSEEALAEIERCGGAQFDPKLVATFVEAIRSMPGPQPLEPGVTVTAAPAAPPSSRPERLTAEALR